VVGEYYEVLPKGGKQGVKRGKQVVEYDSRWKI